MAPSATEEELETNAPAAPEQRQEIEYWEIMAAAYAASREQHVPSKEEEEEEAETKEILPSLELRRARISELLEAAGPRPVTGDDTIRRCLAFMEMELSSIVASLEASSLQPRRPRLADEWPASGSWLGDHGLSELCDATDSILREADDPRRHALLRRAAQCFRRRNSGWPLYEMPQFYLEAGFIDMMRLLPTTGSSDSDLGGLPPPPQAAEAGGLLPLVGIDRPAKKLLRWLVSPRQETADRRSLRVASIVGPAGMGKTTLAMELRTRLSCQATRGDDHFQCIVMARVSRRTDRNERLLQDILSQISDPAEAAPPAFDQSQPKTMELLARQVSERLQDKRYFIIIDDIWEASDWRQIRDAFPDDYLDSRILITTRIASTAWSCSDGLVHEMKPLNQMDSERLLLAKAFGSTDACLLPDNAKQVFEEILRRCEGTPLFIAGMADWLKEQLQQQHQQQGQEEVNSYSEEHLPQLPKRFEQALSPSTFDGLHHGAWTLAMYMSMFPYGYKFDKDSLVRVWFTESFHDRRYLEDCFSQLVDRHVITRVVATNCKRDPNDAEACQWHVNYFMLRFLASKSAEVGFGSTSATLNVAATDDGKRTKVQRRLAFHHPDDPQLPSLLETATDLSRTRWLAVSGAVDDGIPLHKFVNLVVLDLQGWENLKDEDLVQVCRSEMFFLQYLSVRNTRARKLPHEIKELRSLAFLDVSCTLITELPLEVFELTKLIKLDLRATRIRQLPKQIVRLQGTLGYLLLGDDDGMINSTGTAIRVPHGILLHFRFTRLQTLATMDLSQHPASSVRALGELRSLRVLAITWSFHQCAGGAYRDALLSSVARLHDLESLTIHCGLGCSMEFLGSIHDPRPHKLEKFKVTAGRFAGLPKWIGGLNDYRLSFLQITLCRLGAEDLKTLGHLAPLRCLILGLDFVPGEAIVIDNNEFRELQRFSVDCPVPWLTFRPGAMRELTYLQLKLCASQTSVPSGPSGVGNLQSLTEVSLCYNVRYANSPNVEDTVKAVRAQVAGHDNPIDLFINGVQDLDVQAADEETVSATGTQSGLHVQAVR